MKPPSSLSPLLLGLLALLLACPAGPRPASPPGRLPAEAAEAVDTAAARLPGPLALTLWLGGEGETRRGEMEELARRLAASPRVTLATGELPSDAAAQARLDIAHGPALEVAAPSGSGLAFLGYPAGMELQPFLDALLNLAAGAEPARAALLPPTSAFLDSLEKDLPLAVFVSPS